MANFLVYWQDFWNDPGDPREVKGNWASNSDVLFDRANPGDVFWVVITGPEGKRDEWRLLARLVITGKATKATRYGRYFFPGDPERSAVLPIVGQPDLAPILWLLRFEGKKPIRAAGRKIGKSLQSFGFRALDHHDAALLADYIQVLQLNVSEADAA